MYKLFNKTSTQPHHTLSRDQHAYQQNVIATTRVHSIMVSHWSAPHAASCRSSCCSSSSCTTQCVQRRCRWNNANKSRLLTLVPQHALSQQFSFWQHTSVENKQTVLCCKKEPTKSFLKTALPPEEEGQADSDPGPPLCPGATHWCLLGASANFNAHEEQHAKLQSF